MSPQVRTLLPHRMTGSVFVFSSPLSFTGVERKGTHQGFLDSTLPWEGCTTPAPVQKQRSTKTSPGHLIEQGTQLLEEECFAAASGRVLRLDN